MRGLKFPLIFERVFEVRLCAASHNYDARLQPKANRLREPRVRHPVIHPVVPLAGADLFYFRQPVGVQQHVMRCSFEVPPATVAISLVNRSPSWRIAFLSQQDLHPAPI